MCFTCAVYTDLSFLITNEIPGVWLNYFKREYPSRVQKWSANCKLLMCWQNFPKLWCRYKSIIRNRLFRGWTSMSLTENIQEGYRNRFSKTALEFENCKQQLFMLTMCLPACLWGQIVPKSLLLLVHLFIYLSFVLLCELTGRLVAMGHVLMCEIKKNKLSWGVWTSAEILDKMAAALAHFVHNGVQII